LSERIDDLTVRLERERLEADRLYNDALTALDNALITVPVLPKVAGVPADGGVEALNAAWDILPGGAPPVDGGLRGRVQALAWRLLGPSLERQKQFNALLVERANRQASLETARARTLGDLLESIAPAFEGLARFQALLLEYLRTITLYVDSKDRGLAGPEIKERLALTEQRLLSLKREVDRFAEARTPSTAGGFDGTVGSALPAGGAMNPPMESAAYVGFEDRFRGSQADIRARVEEYVPLLSTASDVVDIGCGRGELLDLLKARGVAARGVDANPAMVDVCRARGLQAEQGDALTFLAGQPDASVGALIAIQVVEHFPPGYLVRFLETAFHKLRPGAPIVLETLNPACWLAFFETYLRDLTHQHPLHPDTLRFLVQASGFSSVDVHFKRPVPDRDRLDRVVDRPGADATWTAVAAAVNAHADKLNARLFSSADYAVVGRR
jgi:SAM-dependent methyltransferase